MTNDLRRPLEFQKSLMKSNIDIMKCKDNKAYVLEEIDEKIKSQL